MNISKDKEGKKFVVQYKGKIITSIYTEWEMARNFVASHITMPMHKYLKIKEVT